MRSTTRSLSAGDKECILSGQHGQGIGFPILYKMGVSVKRIVIFLLAHVVTEGYIVAKNKLGMMTMRTVQQ
jgi:hypothetical protein